MDNIFKKFYTFGLKHEHNFGYFIEPNLSNNNNKIFNQYYNPDGGMNQMNQNNSNFPYVPQRTSLPNKINQIDNSDHYMKQQAANIQADSMNRRLNQSTIHNINQNQNQVPKSFHFNDYGDKPNLLGPSIGNKPTIQVDMKVQSLERKILEMEKKHAMDKEALLDIINTNILGIKPHNNQNMQNNLQENVNSSQNNNFRKSGSGDGFYKKDLSVKNQLKTHNYVNEYINEDGEVEDKNLIRGLNLDETKVAIQKIKKMKEDMNKLLENEELRSYNQRSELEAEMKIMHSELMSKFQRLENTRRMQMERVAFILENSGSKRVKAMSKRLFGNCKIVLF